MTHEKFKMHDKTREMFLKVACYFYTISGDPVALWAQQRTHRDTGLPLAV